MWPKMYATIDVPQTLTAIGVVITAVTGLVTALGIRRNTVITKQASDEAKLEREQRRQESHDSNDVDSPEI